MLVVEPIREQRRTYFEAISGQFCRLHDETILELEFEEEKLWIGNITSTAFIRKPDKNIQLLRIISDEDWIQKT